METKKYFILWIVSMVVIALATGVFAAAKIFKVPLSDDLVRGCGVLELVALPVLIFSIVKCVGKDD